MSCHVEGDASYCREVLGGDGKLADPYSANQDVDHEAQVNDHRLTGVDVEEHQGTFRVILVREVYEYEEGLTLTFPVPQTTARSLSFRREVLVHISP